MTVVVKYPQKPAEVQEVDWSGPNGCLDFLRSIVGGGLELVQLTPMFDIWLHREGKLLDLEPNLWIPGDVIVGPVVITGHNGDETIGLTPDEARAVLYVMEDMTLL